ncbi:hypothetical protein SAY87_028754 [Trapa incisa]|uniref:C3H1-type domain-containing protein n=1 Tax=Trapa incisa TaxID=236973 RepID=A0AAN7QSB7_9MYRT|nr:hypothetical protein SAY87_028754 [Trapa incisa]
MELYGLNPAKNGSQSGHRMAEWVPASGDTGLKESMWQLGLGSTESYPERPGIPDCAYYMRTGSCGYGGRCRYNHPRDRTAVVAAVRATGDYPERPGEPACQFYLKTGSCKFGASCKFHHPKHAAGSLICVSLNIYGLPLRLGEKECSYYLKTGQCKFGIACRFHHPQPADPSMPASAPQFYPSVQSPLVAAVPERYGGASTSLRVARPTLMHGSYVPGAYGHMMISPGIVPMNGWSPYPAPASPALSRGVQHAIGATSSYDVGQISLSSSALTVAYPPAGPSRGSQREQVFPERPGEPACQYYMRTGDCKFGSSCRFHHPWDQMLQGKNVTLSSLGLPLRPDVQPCIFYLQNGHCKYGLTCKFDHPIGPTRYNPSASSLIDTPAAPYHPVGSLLGGTLAHLPWSLGPNSSLAPPSEISKFFPAATPPAQA